MEIGRDLSLVDVIDEALHGALVDLHTALPGRIDSFDPATQRAEVTVELQREFERPDGTLESVTVPQIVDVPILFPRAGGYVMTFPVAAGDKCLVVCIERNASGWLQEGAESVPPDARRHSYSDAIAILGLWPSSSAMAPGSSTTALEIRSEDGAVKITVGATDITVETTSAAFTVAAGGPITLTRGANELLAVLSAALDAIATSTVGGVPLSNGATIAAQKALVDVIRS
jgi:hypothetical protein